MALVACGNERTLDRLPNGTWGHLSHSHSYWLSNLAPNSNVTMCGDLQTEAAEAFSSWADASGRKGDLKITLGCLEDAHLKVAVITNRQKATNPLCSSKNLGATAHVPTHSIVMCDPDPALQRRYLLHEMGHLWGMCDVYPEEFGLSSNCDLQWFTGRSSSAVMGANMANRLHAADREGAAALQQRNDRPQLGRPEGSTLLEIDHTQSTIRSTPTHGVEWSEEVHELIKSVNQ